MTRENQKKREHWFMEEYFKMLRKSYDIVEEGEHPDFVVRVGDRVIGVEVLEYHDPSRLPNSFTRREVEAAWDALRDCANQYREGRKDLADLSVWLHFKSLDLPSRREVSSFVAALAAKVIRCRRRDLNDYIYVKICPDDSEILRKYLKEIRLREVDCYMEWDWNFSAGSVGVREEELLETLMPKLSSYSPPACVDESHLVVAGWTGRMSGIVAPLGAWQFERFHELNDALQGGPFDTVAVLCFKHLLWARGEGWLEFERV